MSLTADELKKIFEVKARFYNIQYNEAYSKECRSILEIRRKDTKVKINDGVVIMMNPGSSKPAEPFYNIKLIQKESFDSDELMKISLVETKADNTQYKIMRVIEANKLNYVKVINLSDIRESKSKIFYDHLEKLEIVDTENIHSIFSEKRINELDDVFKRKRNLKIITAWGVSPNLDILIELAYKSNRLKKTIGYYKYNHPRITGWVERVNKEIEKLNN